MVSACCVLSCKNKRVKQANHHIRFYRIPKYNIKRRAEWIRAIGRGEDWKPSAFSRVCSDHFVLGEKSDNKLSPNYVPCIFSHTTPTERRKLLQLFDTHNREVAETTQKIHTASVLLSVVEEELVVNSRTNTKGKELHEYALDSDKDNEEFDLKPDVLYVDGHFVDPKRQLDSEEFFSPKKSGNSFNYHTKIRSSKNEKGTQTILPHDYIRSLEQECSNLRSELNYFQGKYVFKKIELEQLVDAEDKIKYLTGLETYEMLKAVSDTIHRYQSPMFKLTGFQQLLITLMKMRLGLTFPFISILFDVDVEAVVILFVHTVDLLFNKVVPLMIAWPDTKEMRKVLPQEFSDCANCLYAVDCFEIALIETPDTLSEDEPKVCLYKYYLDRSSCYIRRYFMAMAPQGSIIFISKGRHEDVKYRVIIIESEFFSRVAKGDTIVTERELNIGDEVESRGAVVKMSSSVKSKGMNEIDEDGARGLVRIKWVAHSLKQRYQILDGEVPMEWLKGTDSGSFTTLDKIVHVSCALFNMTNKVWTFDRFLCSGKN